MRFSDAWIYLVGKLQYLEWLWTRTFQITFVNESTRAHAHCTSTILNVNWYLHTCMKVSVNEIPNLYHT